MITSLALLMFPIRWCVKRVGFPGHPKSSEMGFRNDAVGAEHECVMECPLMISPEFVIDSSWQSGMTVRQAHPAEAVQMSQLLF